MHALVGISAEPTSERVRKRSPATNLAFWRNEPT
jgi:hypothetical protein